MTFILLMIAIVSFAADDAIVKNGISYQALMNEARATIIDKNLTDIVVESEVSIGGATYPVTYVDKEDYVDVLPNVKTFTFLLRHPYQAVSNTATYLPWRNGG